MRQKLKENLMKKQMPGKPSKRRSVGKAQKKNPQKSIGKSVKIVELAITEQSLENSFSGPVPSPEMLEK